MIWVKVYTKNMVKLSHEEKSNSISKTNKNLKTERGLKYKERGF